LNKRLKALSDMSLQGKISSIYIMTNLFVCLVNVLLILGINRMSGEMELVYRDNLNLNELTESLDAVQNSMTDYLNAKTSDSLEEYYRNSQDYMQLVDKGAEAYAVMKKRYLDLKVILTSSGINLTDIDRLKE